MGDEMEEKRLALRKACEETNAALIEATISSQGSIPTFALEFSNFLRALHAEHPKVVFLAETTFDSEELIEDRVTDAIDNRFEDDDELNAEVTKLCGIVRTKIASDIQAVKDKEGSVCAFTARYADHASLRFTAERTDWSLEFEGRIADVVQEYVAGLDADEDAVTSAKDRQKQVDAEAAVETLMNDPDFRKLKGLPKRCEYVQWKYPQLVPPNDLGHTIRLAQNMPKVDADLGDVIRTAHMRAGIADK